MVKDLAAGRARDDGHFFSMSSEEASALRRASGGLAEKRGQLNMASLYPVLENACNALCTANVSSSRKSKYQFSKMIYAQHDCFQEEHSENQVHHSIKSGFK